jgi:hypothetical protein
MSAEDFQIVARQRPVATCFDQLDLAVWITCAIDGLAAIVLLRAAAEPDELSNV